MLFNSSLARRLLKVVGLRVLFVAIVGMWFALAGCAQLVEGVQLGGEAKPLVDIRAPMILAVGPGTCALTKEGDLYCWGGVNKTYVDENGERQYARDWEPVYKGETKSGKKVKFIYMETHNDFNNQMGYAYRRYPLSPESSDLTLLSEDGEVYRFTYDPGMFLKYGKKRFVEPLEPSHVEGKIKFVKISTSYFRGCGLTKEGKAYCWGDHRDLSLKNVLAGNPNVDEEGYMDVSELGYITYPVPVEMDDGTEIRFEDIDAHCLGPEGYRAICGLGVDGHLYFWGNGYRKFDRGWKDYVYPRRMEGESDRFFKTNSTFYEELLDRVDPCDLYVEEMEKTGKEVLRNRIKFKYEKRYGSEKCEEEKEFVQISIGNSSSCALTVEGKAYCWILEYDHWVFSSSLPLGLRHTYYGREAWGYNLGYGSTNKQLNPVPVARSEKGEALRFKQISVSYNSLGRNHTCAVTFEGKFYCWGSNVTGGLGLGEDFEGESIIEDRYIVSKIQLVPKEVKVGK